MTAHPASSLSHRGEIYVGSEQWRVLRFNDVTRQSVNRVRLVHDGRHERAEARPDCLAFPYLRTMAASGAQFIGPATVAACPPEMSPTTIQQPSKQHGCFV